MKIKIESSYSINLPLKSSLSMFPKAAFIPPAAKTVWESVFALLPRTHTSSPAFLTSIAALSPEPPQPMTNAFEVWVICLFRIT